MGVVWTLLFTLLGSTYYVLWDKASLHAHVRPVLPSPRPLVVLSIARHIHVMTRVNATTSPVDPFPQVLPKQKMAGDKTLTTVWVAMGFVGIHNLLLLWSVHDRCWLLLRLTRGSKIHVCA